MKNKSIRNNFLYSTAYQVLNVLISFVTAPYLSRVLGAEAIGVQSYTQSIQQYFLMFAALGTFSYGSREISMNRDDPYRRSKLFWEIELIVISTTTIALLSYFAFIFLGSKYRIYYIVLSIGIFAGMFDISWFFSGLEEFKLTVIRNTIFKLLGIICTFIFINQPEDLLLYMVIQMVSMLLSNLSLWPYLKGMLVKVNYREFRFSPHLRETFIYFIPSIATSVYTVLDKTLIGVITDSAAQNGYYQQAEKVVNLAKSVVFSAINSVVGVRNAYLFYEKKYDEIQLRIKQSFDFIFFAGFASCFGIMGIAKTFVPLFFGQGYEPVITLLYLFSPIIVVISISNCLCYQYFTPCGKRKQSNYFLFAGSFVNLILNLILIPHLGAYGAAIASVAAETVISILYVVYSKQYGHVRMLVSTGAKKMIAGFLMFIVVFSMNYIKMNSLMLVLLQIAVGAIVYVLFLIILRDKWTWEFLKTAINKIKKSV